MSSAPESPPRAPTIRESRHQQIYPRLSEQQLAAIEAYGPRRRYPAGAILFEEGQRHIPVFVVLAGAIEVRRRTRSGNELIATEERGMFSGEIGQLSGHAALGTGRAREDCEVVVIEEPALRRLIVDDAEVSEVMMRAYILRRMALIEEAIGGATVVGSRQSGDTLRLRQFLTRNNQPHTYLDLDRDAAAATLLQQFSVGADDLPVVISTSGIVMRNPTMRILAERLGLGPDRLDGRTFDVAVVGAGPAGLAAAVYAASEGLRVLVLDANAPGGQAGSSSRIENYFGFPTGITGRALAGRGFTQAEKFGAELAIPREVVRLECAQERATIIEIDGGERVVAHAVVIATGARYHKPGIANLERFEGRGIYYAASGAEAQLCAGEEVIIVGGGNSAGQAAVYLAGHAKQVHVLVRAPGLAASMSDYLIRRIEAAENITLRTETELVALEGDVMLESVRWRHNPSGAVEERPIQHVFLFCGADPNAKWIEGCIALDAAGFVKTGTSISADELRRAGWPLSRPPHAFETSRPGVFAVGDVRSGSIKRVAAAVGEGATAVQLLHGVLSEMRIDHLDRGAGTG